MAVTFNTTASGKGTPLTPITCTRNRSAATGPPPARVSSNRWGASGVRRCTDGDDETREQDRRTTRRLDGDCETVGPAVVGVPVMHRWRQEQTSRQRPTVTVKAEWEPFADSDTDTGVPTAMTATHPTPAVGAVVTLPDNCFDALPAEFDAVTVKL